MLEAYKNYWKQYTDFSGITNRPGFWWVYLMNALIIFGFWLITIFMLALVFSASGTAGVGFSILFWLLWLAWVVANIVPWIAITVRRLRDAGYDWPWIFIAFVPGVGSIALIVLLCMPSKVMAFGNYQQYQQYQQYPNQGAPTTGFQQPNPMNQSFNAQAQQPMTGGQPMNPDFPPQGQFTAAQPQAPQQPLQGAAVQPEAVQEATSTAPTTQSQNMSESGYTESPFQ
ncbi:DUF805 domain-containing protein [Streptococcus dentasini]